MKYLVALPVMAAGCLFPSWIASNCREDLMLPATFAGVIIGGFLILMGFLICASRTDRER